MAPQLGNSIILETNLSERSKLEGEEIGEAD